ALGSFTTWDPLCEKYPWLSPYSYCGGDPVNHSDSTGLDWVSDDDNNSRYWKWNDDVTSLDEALAAGFSSYLPKGSIIENARIGNGKLGSVYLGYDSSDVSYTHSNKTVTPFQVGVEWLTGKGPRERIFHDGDYFTELLRQHSHYRSAVRQASIAIQNGKVEDSYDYELGGIGGVGKYLIDYSTLSTLGLTGNLAVTYLGSYRLSWRGERLEDSIVIRITVSNTSTIQSASRPPVIGYWPIWRNTIGSWINNCFQTGYFSPTTQIFYMTENIKL
ncbi:MAG: hypothetical protein K2O49_06510, partial [Muribaculaceae bacterium]|nr:hypothetical protein [Muribaculaceae bacterium]